VAPVQTASPARAFAPLVHLERSEKSFPIGAGRFIQRSTLKWRDGHCAGIASLATGRVADKKTDPGVPRLRASRLGGSPRPYSAREHADDCKTPVGPMLATTDLTRPNDSRPDRADIPYGSGFYLDLLTDSVDGDPTLERKSGQLFLAGTPAYYEAERIRQARRDGLRIVYWLLYGHSDVDSRRGETSGSHEGDWEQVEVVARRDRRAGWWLPVSVRYGQRSRPVPWRDAERHGSHPVVYSARSSHRPYGTAGDHVTSERTSEGRSPIRDVTGACEDCARWETWESLRRVEAEPWFGFGGGWGFAERLGPWFVQDRDSKPVGDGAAGGPLGPIPAQGHAQDGRDAR
jgi:hypothetical protein